MIDAPNIYQNRMGHIAIVCRQSAYDGAITLLRIAATMIDAEVLSPVLFDATYSLAKTKKEVYSYAKELLENQAHKTTSARTELETLCLKGAKEVPVPTTPPKTKKPTKSEERTKEVVKKLEAKKAEAKPTPKEEQPPTLLFEPTEMPTAEASEARAMSEPERIVEEAKQRSAKALEEAKLRLEEAKKKAEELKALNAARAEAKRIDDQTKRELDKIKAQIAALGSPQKAKKPRKAKGPEESIQGLLIERGSVDFLPERKTAKGECILAIIAASSVTEALQADSRITEALILECAKKDYINLVEPE